MVQCDVELLLIIWRFTISRLTTGLRSKGQNPVLLKLATKFSLQSVTFSKDFLFLPQNHSIIVRPQVRRKWKVEVNR